MKEIIKKLTEQGKTISTMESCTGGGVANAITNIEGASSVFKFSAVTYSNDFKIKMGVNKNIIEKYTVYSMNTANEMSKNISIFADSDFGVGITGKINREDKNNKYGKDNVIFISIYEKSKDQYHTKEIEAITGNREENKLYIINNIIDMLKDII